MRVNEKLASATKRILPVFTGPLMVAATTADLYSHELTYAGRAIPARRIALQHTLARLTKDPDLAHAVTIHIGNTTRSCIVGAPFIIAGEYCRWKGLTQENRNLVTAANVIEILGLATVAYVNIATETTPMTRETEGDIGFGVGAYIGATVTAIGITENLYALRQRRNVQTVPNIAVAN